MADKFEYTQVPDDMWEKLGQNAGMLVDAFDPDTRDVGTQIGATTGGITVTCTPTFVDMGDDVDNCPKNTMELKKIQSYECKVSGTMLTIDKDALARFMGAADVSGKKVTPRMRLTTSDFKAIWYVIDYGDGGYIAVKLGNALSTSGFSLKSTDQNKSQFAFEFTGHSSLANQDKVPMEFYVDGQSADHAEYSITADEGMSDGSVSFTVAGVSSVKAAAGDEVTVVAVPDSGYELSAVTVTKAGGGSVTVTNNKFTMPSANVTVSAVFAVTGGGD